MMSSIVGALSELGESRDWLATANVILSVLLALWMFRYRALYLKSRQEQRYNSDLIENLSEGIYRSTLDGKPISSNRALARLNGYQGQDEMLRSMPDIATDWYVNPNRRAEFRDRLRKDGQVEDFVSEVYRHKSRERIWVSENARLVYGPSGRPLFCEGSVREITETIKRLRVEEQFQKLTRGLPCGLFQFLIRDDLTVTTLYLSEGVARITGIPYAEHQARPQVFDDCIFAEDREDYVRAFQVAYEALQPWDHEFRLLSRDGIEKWVRITAHPERSGDEVIWHGYVIDVSSHKRQEIAIRELAYFDPLTKLPNRRMFLNRMAEAIASCEKTGGHGALLYIDLDNFKVLNDTQGHDIGDDFLLEVAARLRGCVRPGDLVARIGGDEFVVIVEQSGSEAARATLRGITIANQILSLLRQEFKLGELRHVASASVGLVVFDGAEKRPDEIMKRADIAMYQAKAAGRNGLALFDPVTMDREAARYRLMADLRSAVPSGELALQYQPQVDDSGIISGAEALLRWHHPREGMLLPAAFLSLADQSGLGTELTGFVFAEGIASLARWQRDPATAHLRLALNVSAQSFLADGFVPMVSALIERHAIDAGKLTLELTETVMSRERGHISARMDEVKRLGLRLSLDDFGTGHSSLAFLKQLPFDEVKIDGGFVADIESTDSDRALVKTILAMARTLKLTAVAEHVENVRQEAFLRAFGCDFFQGYLYARPMSPEAFLEMARNNPAPALQRHA